MKKLTVKQAFLAMVLFLEDFYEQTNSEDVGALLSSLIILDDGSTADPAMWNDWLKNVERVSSYSKQHLLETQPVETIHVPVFSFPKAA